MRMRTIGVFVLFLGCLAAAAASAAAPGPGAIPAAASAVQSAGTGTGAVSSPGTSAGPDPDTLAKHIYLGQLYPSGNIYLVPFPLASPTQSDMDYQKTFPWPQSLSWHAIFDASPVTDKTKAASLSGVLHDTEQDNVISSPYIPALEAMDDGHESCGGGAKKPKNSRYLYLGDDFFRQVLDNCNSMEGTAVYKGDRPGIFSYSVVAFDPAAPLSDIKLLKNKRRPLTPEEAAAVAKDKAEFKQAESECTTNATFLDEAELLMTAKVTGTDLTVRLSRYETAGCGGHLAAYYILDVLKGGALIKKYELEQYIGVI